MAGLQRSVETFRRSGSSGLVWEDRFSSSDANHQHMQKGAGGGMLRRSVSAGAAAATAHRTGSVSPSVDPPSPTVSGCCFCGIFRRHNRGRTDGL